MIKVGILYVRKAFLKAILNWLDILQRLSWGDLALNDASIKQKRRHINRWANQQVLALGPFDRNSPQKDRKTLGFYRSYSIHFSLVGLELHLDTLQEKTGNPNLVLS